MAEASFRTFQHYKNKMTENRDLFQYQSVCQLLYDGKNTTDIKLPVPIRSAKIMLSFSTLHKLHNKKNYSINGILFHNHIPQIS